MSKSMAIEGIMKIFLMIAVIIVGMSFLMKAFGIDIFGWLNKQFEGFDIPLTGKAVHIKAKIGGAEKDVWEFHLLSKEDAKKHLEEKEKDWYVPIPIPMTRYDLNFYLGKHVATTADGFCLIYTGEERPDSNYGYIYYIQPGATLQAGSGNFLVDRIDPSSYIVRTLSGCQAREVVEENPECTTCVIKGVPGTTPCEGEISYVNCAGGTSSASCDEHENVLNQFEFGDRIKIADYCAIDHKKECNLLQPPTKTTHDFFGNEIKYGLVCDQNGMWRTCTDSAKSDIPLADCDFTGDVGTWTVDLAKIPENEATTSTDGWTVARGGFPTTTTISVDRDYKMVGEGSIKFTVTDPDDPRYRLLTYTFSTPVSFKYVVSFFASASSSRLGLQETDIIFTDNSGRIATTNPGALSYAIDLPSGWGAVGVPKSSFRPSPSFNWNNITKISFDAEFGTLRIDGLRFS